MYTQGEESQADLPDFRITKGLCGYTCCNAIAEDGHLPPGSHPEGGSSSYRSGTHRDSSAKLLEKPRPHHVCRTQHYPFESGSLRPYSGPYVFAFRWTACAPRHGEGTVLLQGQHVQA